MVCAADDRDRRSGHDHPPNSTSTAVTARPNMPTATFVPALRPSTLASPDLESPMVPSPSPAGRPDQDDQPSIKIGVAASMLRRGYQPLDVANATDVPLALVELIATESRPDPPKRPAPTPPAGTTSSMLDEPRPVPDDNPVRPDLSAPPNRLGASRWATGICCAAVLVVLGTVGLAAAADITHNPALAIAAVILTPLLLTVLGLCAIACACTGPGGSRRPR